MSLSSVRALPHSPGGSVSSRGVTRPVGRRAGRQLLHCWARPGPQTGSTARRRSGVFRPGQDCRFTLALCRARPEARWRVRRVLDGGEHQRIADEDPAASHASGRARARNSRDPRVRLRSGAIREWRLRSAEWRQVIVLISATVGRPGAGAMRDGARRWPSPRLAPAVTLTVGHQPPCRAGSTKRLAAPHTRSSLQTSGPSGTRLRVAHVRVPNCRRVRERWSRVSCPHGYLGVGLTVISSGCRWLMSSCHGLAPDRWADPVHLEVHRHRLLAEHVDLLRLWEVSNVRHGDLDGSARNV